MMRIKHSSLVLLAGFVFSLAGSLRADTWYVSQTSPQDGPGTAWTNAFHILQDGVDAADSNDVVLVTNGTYDVGGAVIGISNRVAITEAIRVQSVNGPESTLIVGQGPIGSNAVRCAYLELGAELIGVTLTNGHTYAEEADWNERAGGGAWCKGGGLLRNCIITGNSASQGGGGIELVLGGTVLDCSITSNSATTYGGGISFSMDGGAVSNCTISSNVTVHGVRLGVRRNSTVPS